MQASPCNDQDEQGKPRHMKNLLGGLAASINAGRPANSVCEQWERSSTKTSCRSERLRGREAGTWGEMCKRAAGEITHSACHGITTEKGWCLEELKYIRSVLKLWAEVIYGSAAVQTPILTAASTMAQISKNLITLLLFFPLRIATLRPQPLFRTHGKPFLLKRSQLKLVNTQKMLQYEQVWHVEKRIVAAVFPPTALQLCNISCESSFLRKMLMLMWLTQTLKWTGEKTDFAF